MAAALIAPLGRQEPIVADGHAKGRAVQRPRYGCAQHRATEASRRRARQHQI